MQGRFTTLLISALLFAVALIAVACGESQAPSDNDSAAAVRDNDDTAVTVRDIVERLQAGGVECSDLVVREPKESGGGEGSVQGIVPQSPSAVEVGFCQLKGTPTVHGRPLASMVLIFDSSEHLDWLPTRNLLTQQEAFVYGGKWEFYVSPPNMADEVHAVLGGTVIMPPGKR